MYSSFNWEDIEVVDKKGLFDWLMSIKDDKEYEDFMGGNYLIDIIDGKEFSFDGWDNIKLISYWYKSQTEFLKKISKFIKGEVHWVFENEEESAYVKFDNGKTIFYIGEMKYTEYKAEDFLPLL